MSAIGSVFSGPLAQAVGWALLHLLWQGVLVAAILAATLALLRRQSANTRYLASCGALVLIAAFSVGTAYRAYDPVRVAALTPSRVTTFSQLDAAATTFDDMTAAVVPATATDRLAVVASFAGSHLPEIVLVWLVGVTLLSARLIAGWLGAHRLAVRHARPAEPKWEIAMNRIAEALQLRRTIRLLESAAVEVPTVIGWLRPVVLLPVATLSGLSTEQIEMILAHELGHIRRHDFIVNLLQSTVETLFFYQPAVWWISRRIRVEREHCCDDLAVSVFGDPIRYARALTRFEELRIGAAQSVVAASGGSLFSRIHRLVIGRGESANWSSRWAAGAALLTVVAALLLTPSLPLFASHDPEAAPPPPPPPHTTIEVTTTHIDETSTAECDTTIDADVNDDVDVMDDIDTDDFEPPTPPTPPTPAVAAVPAAFPYPARTPMAMVAPRVSVTPVIAPAIRAAIQAAAIAPVALRTMSMADAISDGVIGAFDGNADDDDEDTAKKTTDDGKLSVDDLIALRNAGVTPQYIEEMRNLFGASLKIRHVAEMRMHGVSNDYVRDMRSVFGPTLTARDIIGLRVQGVSAEDVRTARSLFGDALTAREAAGLKAVGVTSAWLRDMRAAGVEIKTARDASSLRALGVTPAFVKALSEAGYTRLTASDLRRLASSGVTADFIREMQKYRTNK